MFRQHQHPPTIKWVICTHRRVDFTRQSLGCTMQHITDRMRHMQLMLITTTPWLSMEVFYGYRSNMVIVQGERQEAKPEEEQETFSSICLSTFQITSRSTDCACFRKCGGCLFKLSNVWWVVHNILICAPYRWCFEYLNSFASPN